jgi:hypothetical protein
MSHFSYNQPITATVIKICYIFFNKFTAINGNKLAVAKRLLTDKVKDSSTSQKMPVTLKLITNKYSWLSNYIYLISSFFPSIMLL